MKRAMRRRGGWRLTGGARAALQWAVMEGLEGRVLMSVNVLTYHNDLARQGWNAVETQLTPANVNQGTFGKLFTYPVAGQVYAQPLYVSNLTVPGVGLKNVVFVATQHNDVYAFDADSPAGPNGGVLWHVNLGPSAATPNSYFANRYGPYHDINPQVGITSTPVIDLAAGTMYVDAFTNDVPGQNAFSHHLWSLDLATGANKTTPMLVAATLPGTSAGAVNGTLTFTAAQQLQRSALTLFNGTLYVAYTGYADTNPYHGWILGFNPTTLQLKTAFVTTPTVDTDASTQAGEGGIWQTGNGLASDGSKLYVMVANGDFNASATSMDWGDSFLELTETPAAATTLNGYGLTVTDSFTPFNEQSLANADQDLGSGGSMILPDQAGAHPHILVGAGKGGVIYVVDRDNMGGFNASTDNVIQKVSLGHGVFSSPAFFNNMIYYHAVGDVLKAFSVSGGTLSAAPVGSGAVSYAQWGATPSVSSNGLANGIVWDMQWNGTHEVLRAYNATPNGGVLTELYNSNQNVARDQLGVGVKFTVPTVADGKVFVGTDGALSVFGILVPPVAAPSAPTGLAASNAVANQVVLTWTDTATSETGFTIERSTDGVTFGALAAMASANAISFTDTTVAAGVMYWYRVRATNGVGNSTPSNVASVTAVGVSVPQEIYAFDEGKDTTAADSAGGNNGVLVGSLPPQWVAGRVGTGALNFRGNGTSSTLVSAVQVATNLGVILGTTSSLSAWIKTTQVGSDSPYAAPAITGAERAGNSSDVRWGYIDATGHIAVSAGNNVGAKSTTVINDGNWHHVAFTRNASTGQTQVYVDGNLEATASGDTGTKDVIFRLIGAQSNVLAADGATVTSATYFNGQIDDIRIFNQILSTAEVMARGKVPAVPTGVAANALSGALVQVTWTNMSSFATAVEVYRSAGTTGSYALLATLGGSATLYNDTTVTAGTQYSYKVRAVDHAGASGFSAVASATPPRPTIVGRYTFYNNSAYDGDNGSSNIVDDRAIAPDKAALLAGQTATFANYTSYSRGLNGVMIDLDNFLAVPGESDFVLKVGNSADVGTWADAPVPTYVTAYPGRGVNGTTRLEILFENNAIQNEWLQVTMLANSNTMLAMNDVFYFGNAIGETGDVAGDTQVTITDLLGPRGHPGTDVGLTNVYDFNRDKNVDEADVLVAKGELTNAFNALILLNAPAIPVPVPELPIVEAPIVAVDSTSPAAPDAPISGVLSVTANDTLGAPERDDVESKPGKRIGWIVPAVLPMQAAEAAHLHMKTETVLVKDPEVRSVNQRNVAGPEARSVGGSAKKRGPAVESLAAWWKASAMDQ